MARLEKFYTDEAVSYTHLDVYKRQPFSRQKGTTGVWGRAAPHKTNSKMESCLGLGCGGWKPQETRVPG